MHFAYGVPLSSPLNPALSTASALSTLASHAEARGFDAIYVTEHPVPSQRWRERGGHDALDPFVALSVMSQRTSTLRLLTNVTVIPYRSPFLLAKATASLDVLSGGRLILGAGVGYMKAEFAALGVDFETRNERFDEYLEVLKMAWSGDPVTYQGRFVDARAVTIQPPPLQRPRPPIWLGGNSALARRRVVEMADGWMPMPSPPLEPGDSLGSIDGLIGMLAHLRQHADAIGRTAPIDVMCVLPLQADVKNHTHTVDLAERLATLGVTWLAVNGMGASLKSAMDFMDRFASGVLSGL